MGNKPIFKVKSLSFGLEIKYLNVLYSMESMPLSLSLPPTIEAHTEATSLSRFSSFDVNQAQ